MIFQMGCIYNERACQLAALWDCRCTSSGFLRLTGFCSSSISLGYYGYKAMRQTPPLEDDKEMSELAHTLYSLSPPPPCTAADWLAGTAETQWHRAGTSVNLR